MLILPNLQPVAVPEVLFILERRVLQREAGVEALAHFGLVQTNLLQRVAAGERELAHEPQVRPEAGEVVAGVEGAAVHDAQPRGPDARQQELGLERALLDLLNVWRHQVINKFRFFQLIVQCVCFYYPGGRNQNVFVQKLLVVLVGQLLIFIILFDLKWSWIDWQTDVWNVVAKLDLFEVDVWEVFLT